MSPAGFNSYYFHIALLSAAKALFKE